ncbi:MAG: ribonuclease III [Alphaproteobacteria bacterium]|nr:ribonuclease III [Alphaproteobacteria bacterium]
MLKNLETNLSYKFKDIKNLEKALTHSSFFNSILNSNERLEFLGDKILGSLIADILYSHFSKKDEGFLSKSFSYLTSAEVLCDIGRDLGIAEYIRHNTSLEDSVIADTMEAIIASVYIDSSDFNVVKNFIKKHWDIYIKNYNEDSIYKAFNPKSTLQNWAQKRGLKIPEYVDVSKSGSEHEPVFYVKVVVEGYDDTIGEGKNKKIAQKDAALKFIETYNIK